MTNLADAIKYEAGYRIHKLLAKREGTWGARSRGQYLRQVLRLI